jgi:four helix bundle protein
MKDEKEGSGHGTYDLRRRTMDFALRILALCARLPGTPEGMMIRRQLGRSGTSPGSHYREACRARSGAEFASKLDGGLQELDETGYWLELLDYSGVFRDPEVNSLLKETEELTAIFVTCSRNAKRRNHPSSDSSFILPPSSFNKKPPPQG